MDSLHGLHGATLHTCNALVRQCKEVKRFSADRREKATGMRRWDPKSCHREGGTFSVDMEPKLVKGLQ